MGGSRGGIAEEEHSGGNDRWGTRGRIAEGGLPEKSQRGNYGITEPDLQRRQHAGNCGAELQGWGTRIAEDEHAGIAEGEHTGE